MGESTPSTPNVSLRAPNVSRNAGKLKHTPDSDRDDDSDSEPEPESDIESEEEYDPNKAGDESADDDDDGVELHAEGEESDGDDFVEEDADNAWDPDNTRDAFAVRMAIFSLAHLHWNNFTSLTKNDIVDGGRFLSKFRLGGHPRGNIANLRLEIFRTHTRLERDDFPLGEATVMILFNRLNVLMRDAIPKVDNFGLPRAYAHRETLISAFSVLLVCRLMTRVSQDLLDSGDLPDPLVDCIAEVFSGSAEKHANMILETTGLVTIAADDPGRFLRLCFGGAVAAVMQTKSDSRFWNINAEAFVPQGRTVGGAVEHFEKKSLGVSTTATLEEGFVRLVINEYVAGPTQGDKYLSNVWKNKIVRAHVPHDTLLGDIMSEILKLEDCKEYFKEKEVQLMLQVQVKQVRCGDEEDVVQFVCLKDYVSDQTLTVGDLSLHRTTYRGWTQTGPEEFLQGYHLTLGFRIVVEAQDKYFKPVPMSTIALMAGGDTLNLQMDMEIGTDDVVTGWLTESLFADAANLTPPPNRIQLEYFGGSIKTYVLPKKLTNKNSKEQFAKKANNLAKFMRVKVNMKRSQRAKKLRQVVRNFEPGLSVRCFRLESPVVIVPEV